MGASQASTLCRSGVVAGAAPCVCSTDSLTCQEQLLVAGLNCLPRHLQQQALLGVHQVDLVGGEGEEGGVKAVDAAKPAAEAGLKGGLAVLRAAGAARGQQGGQQEQSCWAGLARKEAN